MSPTPVLASGCCAVRHRPPRVSVVTRRTTSAGEGETLTYLFTRANQDLLEMFAWSNVLLAFDYDGTLAPLVNAPARATMRLSTRRLLRRASKLYPCVVITGRAQARCARPAARHRGVSGRRQSWGRTIARARAMRRRVQRWLPILKARLSRRQGVIVEDKGFSVTVHYRQARQRNAARRAILTAARSLNDVRIIGGKLAVNLLVPDAPHKGLALERERAHFACDTVIYVGDDETDEDVFQLDRPGRLLSIRVGQKRTSAAPYYIRNQAEIDRLLGTLVALRGDRHD